MGRYSGPCGPSGGGGWDFFARDSPLLSKLSGGVILGLDLPAIRQPTSGGIITPQEYFSMYSPVGWCCIGKALVGIDGSYREITLFCPWHW